MGPKRKDQETASISIASNRPQYPGLQLPYLEQRVRTAHKDGFWTAKIPKYGSQNVTVPLEKGSF